ncbi:NAD(P)H-dependent oxidoreductase [Thaumasiovibrio subtropicus]|uniref:NAD(P)H-dependent oxidoreductase n=1 Tax=Thaumasiovibrio subtropicus TaxID=1891207 RepID=UPI000B35C44B|nr:NAD(P)H-dependent oxidoreductase [Thaumasiovibrio subtropicus]
MATKRVLVLYAHPSQHRSEVNFPLRQAAQEVEGVTLVDLYYEYPNFDICIDREQKRLLSHDVVIFQFPLYWYSTPSILKEWQDLILEYGFAYGQEGTQLHGKPFLCALSAGGKAEAYRADGYNHFTIGELLQPLEQMANLTGMVYLPPFAIFGSRTAVEDKRVAGHVEQYRQLLHALVDDKVDIKAAQALPILTDNLRNFIKDGA